MTSLTTIPRRLLLIYDGHCGVCTRLMRLAKVLDTGGRVTLVPNQQRDLLKRVPLTRKQVDQSVWAMTPDGRLVPAAGAFNLAFAVMWRTWLPWRLYWLPPIKRLQDALY